MKVITPQELKERLDNKEDFQLIDVREDYQFDDYNLGGINIPLAQVFSSIEKIATDKPVIFCCNSGKKSAAVIHTLKRKLNLNIENVYSLQGGIPAYKKEIEGNNKPTT